MGYKNIHSTKSTIEQLGDVVTQIIQFDNGEQKTFEHVITSSIRVGKFTKFKTTDGKMISVQHNKVNWFESIPE